MPKMSETAIKDLQCVKLTYFKPSGKYYSEAEDWVNVKEGEMITPWGYGDRLRGFSELPGLVCSYQGWLSQGGLILASGACVPHLFGTAEGKS